MEVEEIYARGVEKSRLKNYLGAIEDYTMVIELTSVSIRKTVSTKHPDGTIEHTDIIETSEGNINAHFNRACAYFDLSEYENAIHDFSKVIEYMPEDAEAFFKRATAFYCIQKDDDASVDLDAANKIDPKYNKELFLAQFKR